VVLQTSASHSYFNHIAVRSFILSGAPTIILISRQPQTRGDPAAASHCEDGNPSRVPRISPMSDLVGGIPMPPNTVVPAMIADTSTWTRTHATARIWEAA
jgi:hypothetical protein